MTFKRLFLAHPNAIGETYAEHFGHALSFAGALFVCAFACLVHAVVPALCETTASRSLRRLQDRMTIRSPITPALGGAMVGR